MAKGDKARRYSSHGSLAKAFKNFLVVFLVNSLLSAGADSEILKGGVHNLLLIQDSFFNVFLNLTWLNK